MTPRPAYETDHDDRLQRLEDNDRETASQIAASTVQIAAITERVSEGFERMGDQLDRITQHLDHIGVTLQTHGQQLTDLSGTRDRQRAVGKWVASVACVVVAALVLFGLGLKR